MSIYSTNYTLTVSKLGFGNDVRVVIVTAGQNTAVGDILLNSNDGSVSGRILDADTGLPIGGASISLVGPQATYTTTTLADGTFSLTGVRDTT